MGFRLVIRHYEYRYYHYSLENYYVRHGYQAIRKAIVVSFWRPSVAKFGSSAAVQQLVKAVARNDPDAVRSAITNGADPNAAGDKGLTPLLFAIGHKGSMDAIRALVECGADLNFRPPGAPRPMGLAAKAEDGELLRLFLELGVAPDPADPEEEPYTATAVYSERFENFRCLLDAGADLDAMVGPESSLVGFLIELEHWAWAVEVLRRGANLDLVTGSALTRDMLDRYAPAPASADRDSYLEVLSLLGLAAQLYGEESDAAQGQAL